MKLQLSTTCFCF